MIGYLFGSFGFGLTDLLMFGLSLIAAAWVVWSWRRGISSRAGRLLAVGILLLALAPFVLLGLAYVAAGSTSPSASTVRAANGQGSLAVNMGPVVNSAGRDAEPSFTADGQTMYFNCHNVDICVSHLAGTWEEGKWTTPELLGAPISTGYKEVEPMISAAGDKLYFTSDRPARSAKGNSLFTPFVTGAFTAINTFAAARFGVTFFDGLGLDDVWVSYQVNGVWSEPQNLGEIPGEPPVNSAFSDHCLSFSADGSEAFWASTRPGGFGGNDIWTSRRADGKWTRPQNLGPRVNSAASEHHAMPSPDGRALYITSDRPGGYGSEDIYITTRAADGQWGPPVNLGPQINGPGNDRCLVWTPDHRIFIFDSTRAGGFGSRDMWWVYAKDITVGGFVRAY